MNIAVSYHDTVPKLQGLSHDTHGPFDRPEWFDLLARHCDGAVIVHAHHDGQEAALALTRKEGAWESLANWFTFTWRPLRYSPQALQALARDLRRQACRVTMAPVPDEDGSASLLENAFGQAGWLVFRERCDENHVLPVRHRTFAEYWAARPGRMRTTLKRKAHKVDIEILTRFDDAAWSAYQVIYAESWKPHEERADILEDFARSEGAAGRLRLGIARADGVPIAAQFWTVENSIAYIHKLAHAEGARPLSAGTTLSAALFAHAIDTDRVELIDFGTGSDAYKRDWMEQVRPRYRLTCLDWRKPRAWPDLAKVLFRRLAPRKSAS